MGGRGLKIRFWWAQGEGSVLGVGLSRWEEWERESFEKWKGKMVLMGNRIWMLEYWKYYR
jgi:hypothetical protein